jgi:hypothetical protein
MKIIFSSKQVLPEEMEEDFEVSSLQDDIAKTRVALEIAYAGFDDAIEPDLIDCYIYEINALQKRYTHLTTLSELEGQKENASLKKKRFTSLYKHSPVRALVSQVFG